MATDEKPTTWRSWEELRPITDKVRKARTEGKQELVERGTIIDLLWAATLARVHGILLGEPGVAKSMLIRNLMSHITDAEMFEILLNKDTPPELMWGPISMQGMKQDRFERIVDGYMPSANIGFWDELFRSNSTNLNTGLPVINERIFKNGRQTLKLNVWSVFGATNFLPGADAEILAAFADRFGLRYKVNEVTSQDGLLKILDGQIVRNAGGDVADSHTTIERYEVEELQTAAARVEVPPEIRVAITELISNARGAGLRVSVRRIFEGLKLAQVGALLNDEQEVKRHHLRVFMHILWNDEDEIEVADQVTLDFAGKVSLAERKHRIEFDDFRKRLTELQQETPPAGDLTTEQTKDYRNIGAGLKEVVARIDASIADAEKDGDDPAELISIREDVKAAHKAVTEVLVPGLDL